jgi:hypothetical protein
MALANARRGRLRAFALHAPGEDLPAPLRLQLYGLWTASEADLAIRHLIDSAINGAQTAVQTLKPGEGGGLPRFDVAVPLVAGWVRGRTQAPRSDIVDLLTRHGGDAVFVADHAGRAFSEVLALGKGAALAAIARPLGACYPLFEVPAPNAKAARKALADASKDTLVLLGLPGIGLGPFAEWAGCLQDAAPGTVGAVLPRGGERRAVLEALLG